MTRQHRSNLLAVAAALALAPFGMAAGAAHAAAAKKAAPAQAAAPIGEPAAYEALEHHVGDYLVIETTLNTVRLGNLIKYTNPALTLQLGTDDQASMTTLADTDLYDDLPSKIANIRNLRGHPYEFYQKLGFKIVGVVPDANGIGKPDILMAKRITPAAE